MPHIEQSGTSLLLKVDNDSIGYDLEEGDEIVLWGKFETVFNYLNFDGSNDEVRTDFSGRTKTPRNLTYSFWYIQLRPHEINLSLDTVVREGESFLLIGVVVDL